MNEYDDLETGSSGYGSVLAPSYFLQNIIDDDFNFYQKQEKIFMKKT